jgi:hypothetical protein
MRQKLLDLPLEERALLALKSAVKKAIAERSRQGLPVYIWSGGKVVELAARRLRARSPHVTKRVSHVRKVR